MLHLLTKGLNKDELSVILPEIWQLSHSSALSESPIFRLRYTPDDSVHQPSNSTRISEADLSNKSASRSTESLSLLSTRLALPARRPLRAVTAASDLPRYPLPAAPPRRVRARPLGQPPAGIRNPARAWRAGQSGARGGRDRGGGGVGMALPAAGERPERTTPRLRRLHLMVVCRRPGAVGRPRGHKQGASRLHTASGRPSG